VSPPASRPSRCSPTLRQAAAANADAARVQVGRVPLTSLGVSQAVAQQQNGTTARADPVNGPSVTTIPAGISATSARA